MKGLSVAAILVAPAFSITIKERARAASKKFDDDFFSYQPTIDMPKFDIPDFSDFDIPDYD